MRTHKNPKQLVRIPKKFFAGGGKKGEKIDPNLKDFDVIFLGGLHNGTMIKYLQQRHFHGTMAGFNHRSKFMYEHLYDYVIAGNMKSFKYSAMPYSSLFETSVSRAIKDTITEIHPEQNQLVTAKGEVYNYKALVLNTGLKQEANEDPILKNWVNDGEFGKSRVFVHETGNTYHLSRNTRIFHMHKDNDFIIYLQGGPNKREAYEQWYLAVDEYLTRGLFLGGRPQGMKVRVITPNDYLFKMPFANEVVLEEISNRSMIEVHFGMELQNIEVKETYEGMKRLATFKDLKTGKEVVMNFGTFLTTPANKKRQIYENNDIADEHVSSVIR